MDEKQCHLILNNWDDLQFTVNLDQSIFRFETDGINWRGVTFTYVPSERRFEYTNNSNDLLLRIYDVTPGHPFILLHHDVMWKESRVTQSMGGIQQVQVQIKRVTFEDVIPYYAACKLPTDGRQSCLVTVWKQIADIRDARRLLNRFRFPDSIPSLDDLSPVVKIIERVQPILDALTVVAYESKEVSLLVGEKFEVHNKLKDWTRLAILFQHLGDNLCSTEAGLKLAKMADYFDKNTEWDTLEDAPVASSSKDEITHPMEEVD